jgi:hypothetical protein
MPITVGRWERRDNVGLEAFAAAAFAYCRAVKAQEGVRSSRFFWLSTDRIVVQTEADSQPALDQPPSAAATKALFALSDTARAVDTERWMDPALAQTMYQAARS